MLTLLKDLLRPTDRRPEFDINDPRHPINSGWRRIDVSEDRRRVRFRVTVGDVPKPVPPRPELTDRDFMGGPRRSGPDDYHNM